MNIDSISIFGDYNQLENRVTAAFLHICKEGGEELVRFILGELNIPMPINEILIESQVKGDDSIPDGRLSSNFKFDIYIESKLGSGSLKDLGNQEQLNKHRKIAKEKNAKLLYLTNDDNKPEILEGVAWANWKTLLIILSDYLQKSEPSNRHLVEYLIMNFNILLANNVILEDTWSLDDNKVIIVAGSWAEGIALSHNQYICQNKRYFRPSSYIAFYNESQIRHLFKISQPPKDDVSVDDIQYLNEDDKEFDESGKEKKKRQFMLEDPQSIGPVINDKLDKNGVLCPYTYGQPRYTTLEKIKNASRTSQL